MKTKLFTPNKAHLVYRGALEATLAGPGKDLDAMELLAIHANFLGQLIALQDSTKYTSDQVMQIVSRNIQHGNDAAVERHQTERKPS
jgi:hypothetical protein